MQNAMEAGAQAALLAPTEILARQHHASIQAMLAPLDIEIGLLLGQGRGTANAKTDAATLPVLSRKDTLEKLADGSLSMVVGTHALFIGFCCVSRSWLGGC